MNWPDFDDAPPAPVSGGSVPRTRRPAYPGERPAAPAPLPAGRFALPDGTPLLLTMTRKSHFVQLTGNYGVGSPDEALLLLFLCSPEYDTRRRWVTPAPADEPEPRMVETAPGYFTRVRLEAEAWAEQWPHTGMVEMVNLAVRLWEDQHETAVQPLKPAEKKTTPDACPTGQSPTSGCSAGGIWGEETGCSTSALSGTFTAGSTLGASERESPSSPADCLLPASPAPAPGDGPPLNP